MSDVVLAIDVGGTKTLVGAVHPDGEVVEEWSQATRTGGDDVLRAVEFACSRAIAGHVVDPVPSSGTVRAVAAGFPEYVDADGALSSREVLRWRDQPRDLLRNAFPDAAVVVGSDVRFGALGESRYGAGRGLGSFFYVSLGTGLSSALVLAGEVWAGARGEAIALGEWPAPEGTLEAFASGAGILDRYTTATGGTITGPQLSTRATAGDAVARDILTSAGTALGDAIADAVAVLDPAAVVLGGGLGTTRTPLLDAVHEQYRRRDSGRPGRGPLVAATCGHRSGLLGAAAAGWKAVGG